MFKASVRAHQPCLCSAPIFSSRQKSMFANRHGVVRFPLTLLGSHNCRKTTSENSSGFSKSLTWRVTNMASGKNFEQYESAKLSTNLQTTGQKNHRKHGVRQPTCRKRPSLAALIIIAIALALLLAAVIVIGTTRLQTSINNQPSKNTTTPSQPGPPQSPASAEPPGGDQGLSWCQVQGDGNCTLGVYQNLDSGQIRAQVFDHTCLSTLHYGPFTAACQVS